MGAPYILTKRILQKQFSLKVFINKTSLSLEEKLLRQTLEQLELIRIRKIFCPHPKNFNVLVYENEMGSSIC